VHTISIFTCVIYLVNETVYRQVSKFANENFANFCNNQQNVHNNGRESMHIEGRRSDRSLLQSISPPTIILILKRTNNVGNGSMSRWTFVSKFLSPNKQRERYRRN